MNALYTTKEEVLSDFPIVTEWLEKIESNFSKNVNSDKTEFIYSYGFFLPKSKSDDDFIQLYEKCSKMKYSERLDFELSKVRINLTIKNGNFILSDRLPKGRIPTIIREIVAEITKVKMLVEGEYHGNQDIIDSIPELDKNIISFEVIKEFIKNDTGSVEYDIDEILDKISSQGMESLSEDEKEFLDKKSKGI